MFYSVARIMRINTFHTLQYPVEKSERKWRMQKKERETDMQRENAHNYNSHLRRASFIRA